MPASSQVPPRRMPRAAADRRRRTGRPPARAPATARGQHRPADESREGVDRHARGHDAASAAWPPRAPPSPRRCRRPATSQPRRRPGRRRPGRRRAPPATSAISGASREKVWSEVVVVMGVDGLGDVWRRARRPACGGRRPRLEAWVAVRTAPRRGREERAGGEADPEHEDRQRQQRGEFVPAEIAAVGGVAAVAVRPMRRHARRRGRGPRPAAAPASRRRRRAPPPTACTRRRARRRRPRAATSPGRPSARPARRPSRPAGTSPPGS